MAHEKSCGAVVFTRINGKIKYLIIRSITGTYGFPKGHVEGQETEEETAEREIFEEVGLKTEFLPGFREEDEYLISKNSGIVKQVVYFLGYYEGQRIERNRRELSSAQLLDYEAALELLQFDGGKRVLRAANAYLKNTV